MSQSHLSQRHILRHYGGLKVRDPTPAPASPHRRFAPQLLPPRNCLDGRGAATAGKEFPG